MSARFSARFLALLCVMATAGLAAGCANRERAPAGVSAATAPAASNAVPKASSRSLEVTASFEVDLGGADAGSKLARSLTQLANEDGGYVEQLELGDGSRDGRIIVRLPPQDIDGVRSLLSSNGPVASEQITTKDATDAIADIDARVKAATIEESRIQRLIDERTGSLADVLAAEKALGETRETIERLEAEQRVAHGRVDLATVNVAMKYPLASSEVPFFHRAGVAAADGITFARDVGVGSLMVALRAGPTALIFAAFAFACIRIAKKLRRRVAKAPMV